MLGHPSALNVRDDGKSQIHGVRPAIAIEIALAVPADGKTVIIFAGDGVRPTASSIMAATRNARNLYGLDERVTRCRCNMISPYCFQIRKLQDDLR